MCTRQIFNRSIISLLLLFSFQISVAQDTIPKRNYTFLGFNNFDLRNSSTNAISTQRILIDLYREKVQPKMGKKAGNITFGIYSVFTTYLTMIWSHEFGHSLRAQQVGGHFQFHNAAFPFPYTTMHLPQDISLVDNSLSVTAGFEVNYLNIRTLQRDFINNNGIFNEDLAFSFTNRLMYPIYTSLVVPIDPEDTLVWINTAGDPVHYLLPVFKNYANGQVFMDDRTVNPALVKLYNQAAILATFFNLTDPQFYREIGGAFGKTSKNRKPIFLLGDYHTGWTYGTLFNASPLGYELYMNNYLHVHDQHFGFYIKYGYPFKNQGIGLSWNDMLNTKNLKMNLNIDLWNQSLFGQGISGEIETTYWMSSKIGIKVYTGYKSKGYVLGKQLADGVNLGAGIIFNALSHK